MRKTNRVGDIIEYLETIKEHQIWRVVNKQKGKPWGYYSGGTLNFAFRTMEFDENQWYVIDPRRSNWRDSNVMETE